MAENQRSFAATYAAMTDEEILGLVRDTGALTDEAQIAVREEALRRGMDPVAPSGSASPSGKRSSRPVVQAAGGIVDRLLVSASGDVGYREDSATAPNLATFQFSLRDSDVALPIRGWLLALIVYMLVVPALDCVSMSERLKYARWSDLLGVLYSVELLLKFPALLFMMFAALALMTRLRRCVAIAKISLTIEMIVAFLFTVTIALCRAFVVDLPSSTPSSVLSHTTHNHFYSYVFAEIHFLEGVKGAFYAALPNLIGLFYLHKSRRVRLTYPD